MTGLAVSLCLAASAGIWLLGGSVPGREAEFRPAGSSSGAPERRFRWTRSREEQTEAEAPALLVRELAGLLAAGRSAQRIWADAASLYEHAGKQGGRFAPVLQAAAAAAALGLSPVPVFAAAGGGGPAIGGRSAGTRSVEQDLWAGLAVCVRVSERSGAPLSTVLIRYAGQLDDSRDAAADRDAALAGPRATVRLLTWLPGGGMALGYLLGGNPLQVLAGTPAGWAAAVAGCGFWLAGRVWSGRLVRKAASPPGTG